MSFIDVNQLIDAVTEAKSIAKTKGLETQIQDLDPDEWGFVADALNFEFGIILRERELAPVITNHLPAIALGAMIAKKQMKGAEIQGTMPSANQIGVTRTKPSYLGIGRSWDDAPDFPTGTEANWVHSGTTYLGGVAGNPIRVGANAVHALLAVRNRHPSPKVDYLKAYQHGNPLPVIDLSFATQNSDFHIRELPEPFILKEGTQFRTTTYTSPVYGATVPDKLEYVGVSFVREPVLKALNPDLHRQATYDVVFTA